MDIRKIVRKVICEDIDAGPTRIGPTSDVKDMQAMSACQKNFKEFAATLGFNFKTQPKTYDLKYEWDTDEGALLSNGKVVLLINKFTITVAYDCEYLFGIDSIRIAYSLYIRENGEKVGGGDNSGFPSGKVAADDASNRIMATLS